MIMRFFTPDPTVQRIVHYRGRRPFMALFIFALGIFAGAVINATERHTETLAACTHLPLAPPNVTK